MECDAGRGGTEGTGHKGTFSHRGKDASLPFYEIGEETGEGVNRLEDGGAEDVENSTSLPLILSGKGALRASWGGLSGT